MNNFFEVKLFFEPGLEIFQQSVFLWGFKLADHTLEKAQYIYSLCHLDISCNLRHQVLLITEIIGIVV